MADGIGHNVGSGLDALRARAEALKEQAARALAQPVTHETAASVRDVQAEATKLGKDIEARRREEKKPHEDEAKAVDARFKPVGESVAKLLEAARAALTAFMLAEEKRKREEEAAARRAAEEARKAAEAAAKEADPFSAFDAQQEKEAAEWAAAEAVKLASVRTQVAGHEAARVASLRTSWIVGVTDGPALVRHFANSPTLIEEARKIAAAQVRAAKGADCGIPGISITEEKKAV